MASSGFDDPRYRGFNFGSTASDTRVGWTVGTGIAWAVSDTWSVRVEYDYLDFGSKAYDFSGHIANNEEGIPTSTFNATNNLQIWSLSGKQQSGGIIRRRHSDGLHAVPRTPWTHGWRR
jgi:opacity protein-like surface antigen